METQTCVDNFDCYRYLKGYKRKYTHTHTHKRIKTGRIY